MTTTPTMAAMPEALRMALDLEALDLDNIAAELRRLHALSAAEVEPMFWVRLCSDGGYEGPLHNDRIEHARKLSGAWHPLHLGAAPQAQAGAESYPPLGRALSLGSAAPTLRAMASNYSPKHSWDRLDADACARGAAEIEALRDHIASAAPQAQQPSAAPAFGRWINADDVDRLVHALDVAFNGEAGAAPQACLCDVVSQIEREANDADRPLLDVLRAARAGAQAQQPDPAEVAPEGERAAFEAWWAQSGLAKFKETAFAGWEARTGAQAVPSDADAPDWMHLRSSLAITMLGWAERDSNDHTFDQATRLLDAVTEPGMPLAILRTAPDWRTAATPAAVSAPSVPDGWKLVPAGAAFQQRVQPWLLVCFGELIASDREERNHRFLEESLELVQSTGCTASEAHQLVDYVFGRPVGEPAQEVGGVMVTLAALCLANGLDMHDAGEVELARIWTKVEAIRAKQAAKPKHSPLPEFGAAPTKVGPTNEELFALHHQMMENPRSAGINTFARMVLDRWGTPTRTLQAGVSMPHTTWPVSRDVGRIGDMSPDAHLRVGLDSDNDVYVSVWSEDAGASVEFCNGCGGGGQSLRTRNALIALMVAMEEDNAKRPDRDWWRKRNGAPQAPAPQQPAPT